jgi:hypothetical protein
MPEGAFYGQEGGRRLRRGVVQNSVVEPMPHDPSVSSLCSSPPPLPYGRGGLKALNFYTTRLYSLRVQHINPARTKAFCCRV